MRLISVIGSNATGKGTRVARVIDALGERYTPLLFKGKEVGRIYPEKRICVIGKRQSGERWVSMDSFPCQNWDDRLVFFKELKDSNVVDTLLIEGYFNMVAVAGRPPAWHDIGYDQLNYYFLVYDTVEDFLNRINERLLGKEIKTMQWAKESSGWRDNEGRIKKGLIDFTSTKSEQDTVIKLDINEDEYFFVDLLGLERKNKPKKANLKEFF